jgi:hypothetical protein
MATVIISIILIIIVFNAFKSIKRNGICGGDCKGCSGSCHDKKDNLINAYYKDKAEMK